MINIVVSMAGRGARFVASGERTPKPLLEVHAGAPMIKPVIDFLAQLNTHRLIFVCLEEHERVHGISARLRSLAPLCEIVFTQQVTRGPSASALLAAPFTDGDEELLIAYCDSFLTIDLREFVEHCRKRTADGGLIVYPSSNPADSYAVVDGSGDVLRTAEKAVISDLGTAGFYYFRHGSDFAAAARADADASADELFVCPTYNYLIKAGKRVVAYRITRAQQIEMGTPEDLDQSRQLLSAIVS